MSYEGEKKLQRKRGSEVLVDSLLRQFMHCKDGGGSKPSSILEDQHGGIAGSTRFTPEFVPDLVCLFLFTIDDFLQSRPGLVMFSYSSLQTAYYFSLNY